jgi:glycosyltransferase involved in cell wall biosynthesis
LSPFPPVRTGVAACSAELVAALRARGHLIDTYPEARAHDFPWLHRQRPYDLIVYQFGNSSHHDYIWPYALRYPGLTVLHDTRLHHARAALLLREQRRDDYRRELAWSEPGLNPDAAELAIAGFDSRLYYEWNMCRALVERSRLVAVHGEATRRELVERLSGSRYPMSDNRYPISDIRWDETERIVSMRLGHGELVSAEREAAAREMLRGRYGIPQDAIVFGVFGGLTPEKRVPQILDALRSTIPYAPGARLLLAGAPAAHADFGAATFADLADRVVVTGYVDEAELTDHIAAIDVSLNLRWPTARETSGPWLRALAAGKATVITDLAHLTGFASLDPRTWVVNAPSDIRYPISDMRWTMSGSQAASAAEPSGIGYRASGIGTSEAIAIAIDIVDEDHSLRLAMRRLATDGELRAQLGRAAREHWLREHAIDAMADDYERVMREARDAGREARDAGREARESGIQDPRASRLAPPAPDDTLRALLEPFGIESPL